MLFAVKYRASPNIDEEQIRALRELFMAWQPPHGVEIQHHFHYVVSGGGILIVDTDASTLLFEAVQPFRSMVTIEMEPVVNIIEALAISLDVDEWVKSIQQADGKLAGPS